MSDNCSQKQNYDCTMVLNTLINSKFDYVPPEIAMIIFSHLDILRLYVICQALNMVDDVFKERRFISELTWKKFDRGNYWFS